MSLMPGSTHKIEFKHLEPELALPSDNQAQLATGSRNYQIQTVNISSLHVRIKKLAGSDLIRAFQGYRHYTGTGHDGKMIQPTAPLPWSLIAGETLVDKVIPLETGIDTSKQITLNWDELLPKDLRQAGLFIDVTGTSHPGVPEAGSRNVQSIVQVTDIGLAWKITGHEALVYAFSCDTGAPLPGVKIQLFGEDAAALDVSTTDAAGLAKVPRPDAARHMIASLGADAYLTAYDSTLATVGMWHFPVRYSWNKPAESTREAFLFTDRSLYRPGETVQLKGIIRTLRGNSIEAAQAGPARVVIVDPTDKEILNQPVTISPNGSFDLTHVLAPSKVGSHTIRLEFTEELAKAGNEEDSETNWEERERILENARFEMPLRVEEFRRNAFEITQKIADPAIGATSVTAELSAKYYQGQPVAAGNVKHYSRVSTKNLYPERFQDFLFGNHRSYDWGYWYHYFGYRGEDDGDSTHHTSNLQGEIQLAADGSAKIGIDIPQADFPSPREKWRFHRKSPTSTTRHSRRRAPPRCIPHRFISVSPAWTA
jgi:alpha-2-macroglobulin